MKIAYVTARTPWSSRETFIVQEMLALRALGVELIVAPRNPGSRVVHDRARELLPVSRRMPLITPAMTARFLAALAVDREARAAFLAVSGDGLKASCLVKNVAVLPKAHVLAAAFARDGVSHIHAHWGTTTSTMAMAISAMTGIPWSFTVHRSDISTNNLLRRKVMSAAFCRTISREGQSEVVSIVGDALAAKVVRLHMGVPIYPLFERGRPKGLFTVVCPARLVEKKGHRYLLEAIHVIHRQKGLNLRLEIIGNGPLRETLCQMAERLGLAGCVTFHSWMPHEQLIGLYQGGVADAVVLPSIVASTGDREGIPVALVEAMACGVAVIGTDTGGTAELIGGGAGCIVPPGDSVALAEAVSRLITDDDHRRELARRGWLRAREDFDEVTIAGELARRFAGLGGSAS